MSKFCNLLILFHVLNTFCTCQYFNTAINNECGSELYEIINGFNPDNIGHHCFINISHPYLSAGRGFIPGETYYVSFECSKWFDFRSYIFIVFGSIPQASGSTPGGKHFSCDETLSGITLKGNLTESDTQMKFAWTAPTDEEIRCLTFMMAFINPVGSEEKVMMRKEFCRNPGCYKIFHDTERTLAFDETGPASCWLIIEALAQNNVFVQVLSLQHSNKSTECFGLILSTDEIESTFTGPIRFCSNVTMDNATMLYGSSPSGIIILRYHILENEKMILQLRFFNSLKQGCNETFVGDVSGTIFSPNYPDDYFAGLDCYYIVVGLPNDRIQMTIKEFSLQEPRRVGQSGDLLCDADYFAVVDGLPEMRQWCGSLPSGATPTDSIEIIETFGNILIIHFHTDMIVEAQGFKASWKTLPSCRNQTLTNLSGIITSVNYPYNYLNNQYCITKIVLPKEYAIEVDFQLFRLQPLGDFASWCDEDEDYLSIGNEKFCGDHTNNLEEMKMVHESNEVDIIFHSNLRDTGPGYKIQYNAVTPNKSKECQPNFWAFENFCFQLVDDGKRWALANDDCKLRDGHLAVIYNENVQNFINGKLLEKIDNKDKGYWLGASDLQYESDFTWLDGSRVNFTKWFPGWPEFHYYNRQPNDDGLSGQNCLEIRRRFSYPSKGHGYTDDFYWNDINCARTKPYICQFTKVGNCNETITLTASLWHATIYSPNYPSNYRDFLDCHVVIYVPEKSWMILEFTKFVLEPEIKCNYDYLEIWEENVVNGSWKEVIPPDRYCGDWSYKLKLLRRIASNQKMVLHFHSDHSRGFGGYHANVYFEDASNRRSINVCNNKKLRPYGNNCYLFISFPRVEWETASQICKSSGGLLASSMSYAEEMYMIDQLLTSPDYTTGDVFWLGGQRSEQNVWTWQDKNDFNYTDWFDSSSSEEDKAKPPENCLTLQQQFQTSDLKLNSFRIADRLYWSARDCKIFGGYICKMNRPIVSEGENRSILLEESFGSLTLPGYPENYPNNFDYSLSILAQDKTRILITFTLIDTEYQENCLYDYIELKTNANDKPIRYCGHIKENCPNFASYSNQAFLSFHSDYSITAIGFIATYQVVNISNCYIDTSEQFGYINSVNFPYFYLNALDCETTLRTDINSRILLDFIYFDVGEQNSACFDTDYVAVHLDGDNGRRTTKLCGQLNNANESRNILYISYGNVVKVLFHSNDHNWGVGYRAWYQTLYNQNYTQYIVLKPNETSELKSINYPRSYPTDLCIDTVCRVLYGYQIQIVFEELYLIPEVLPDNMILLNSPMNSSFTTDAVANFSYLSPWNRVTLRYCGYEEHKTAIRRFKSNLTTIIDPLFWSDKALKNYTGVIDECNPNPCYHDAPCLEGEDGPFCQCSPSYLGIFCHFSFCDFNPCINGKCEVTNDINVKYVCQCHVEYTGQHCEFQIHPCESNPCQNGDCHESLGQFTCMCFDGYKGDMCEKKALFEAKTLRESFLRDPFWLGLFMILGVMSSVGIVNCCRKRWSDTKMALLCNPVQPKTERSLQFDEDKEATTTLANNSFDDECNNDDDSEVYFNFTDLGIDPCQYNSLLQIGDVNFKMKLSDLTEEQLETLETYLEKYLQACENNSNSATNQVDSSCRIANLSVEQTDPNTGILVDLDSPNKGVRKAQPSSPDVNAAQKSDGALNLAFDSITDLILKSAEIVRPNVVVHENSPNQRHSVGGPEHMQKFLTRKCDTDSRLLESKQTKTKFRTAAHRAMSLVKRPQSVEIPGDSHEEMKRLFYRGRSSFSVGRTPAFDEESAA